MNVGDTRSLWIKTTPTPAYPQIEAGERFDVAIVGAGIVGVSLAYELRDAGMRVALIEGARVLEGVTGYTTGKLTSQHGLIYHKLEASVGAERARQYYDANQWAIEDVRKRSADCEFAIDDNFIVIREPSHWETYRQEATSLTRLQIPHQAIEGAHQRHGGVARIRFPEQAHFHPRKYLLALLNDALQAGVEVYEHSRVNEIHEEAEGCVVTTSTGDVRARQVVIASHYPIHDSGFFVAKLAPYRSYAIAIRINGPVPAGMYVDHEELPHFRSSRPAFMNGDPVVIVGGEFHKVGQRADADHAFVEIEGWARSRYKVEEVVARWSTQDNWTPDGRPFVGRSPNRKFTFLATGFGGWGMTSGRLAGLLLSHALRGAEHPWAPLYDPARLSFDMAPKMMMENLNAASHLIGDKLAPVLDRKPEDLAKNEAAILAHKDGRVAAFRDQFGTLHMVSANCTHWGCQIAWNSAEKTWDCPCHGSRFGIDGAVLHGPAVTPLEPRT